MRSPPPRALAPITPCPIVIPTAPYCRASVSFLTSALDALTKPNPNTGAPQPTAGLRGRACIAASHAAEPDTKTASEGGAKPHRPPRWHAAATRRGRRRAVGVEGSRGLSRYWPHCYRPLPPPPKRPCPSACGGTRPSSVVEATGELSAPTVRAAAALFSCRQPTGFFPPTLRLSLSADVRAERWGCWRCVARRPSGSRRR
jgi:hypothetical protein